MPLPAAPSTIAAAAFASEGYLNIWAVLLVVVTGNVLGDITMYMLVRTFGRKVLRWIGLKKIADAPALKNIETTIDTYKAPVLIFSRFQVQTTAIVNIISGLGKMNFKKFLFYIFIGELLQATCYILLGYMFAESWESVYAAVGKFSWIIAIIITIVVTAGSNKIIRRILK
jgi:membrane-associated protein